MAIVFHKIKGNLYAYEHYREGKTVRTKYLYPVREDDLKRRAPEHGGGRR